MSFSDRDIKEVQIQADKHTICAIEFYDGSRWSEYANTIGWKMNFLPTMVIDLKGKRIVGFFGTEEGL